MTAMQYQEEVDFIINSQHDQFDGWDRGDVGANQEYVATDAEEAEMIRLAASHEAVHCKEFQL